MRAHLFCRGNVCVRMGHLHQRHFSSLAQLPTLRPKIDLAAAPPNNRRQVCAKAAQAVTELPENLKKIVGAFQMVPDPMARYKQLLFFASKLDSLPSEYHVEENKVNGCVSQVWVRATMSDGKVNFQAESDSQLTKGLAALLVQGLSGSTPQEILTVQPDFIEMLGLKQSLTPSRNNGFLNMFKLMQKKTLEVAAKTMKDENREEIKEEESSQDKGTESNGAPSKIDVDDGASDTPVYNSIVRKLTEALKPTRLDVIDQSSQHAGHMAMKGHDGSGETHFRVEVVSGEFSGLGLVKRHRLIFDLLKDEMEGPVHALTLDTKAPEEVK